MPSAVIALDSATTTPIDVTVTASDGVTLSHTTVVASVAIVLWSASALRNRVDGRGALGGRVAWYGCVVGPVLIVLIAVGKLRLNVHGMGVVVLAHAIWFVVVGVHLCRQVDQQPVRTTTV